MQEVTEAVSKFIVHTKLEEIPHEVIGVGKLHILDTLGTLLAGSREKIAGIVKEYIQALGCKAESSLITQGLKTSAQYAAFGNGTAGQLNNVLMLGDDNIGTGAHPRSQVNSGWQVKVYGGFKKNYAAGFSR